MRLPVIRNELRIKRCGHSGDRQHKYNQIADTVAHKCIANNNPFQRRSSPPVHFIARTRGTSPQPPYSNIGSRPPAKSRRPAALISLALKGAASEVAVDEILVPLSPLGYAIGLGHGQMRFPLGVGHAVHDAGSHKAVQIRLQVGVDKFALADLSEGTERTGSASAGMNGVICSTIWVRIAEVGDFSALGSGISSGMSSAGIMSVLP